MKRILAGSFGVTLSLISLRATADEVVWKAVRPVAAPRQPTASVIPPGTIQAVATQPVAVPGVVRFQSSAGAVQPLAPGVAIEPAGWTRIRAKGDIEEVPPLPKALPIGKLPPIAPPIMEPASEPKAIETATPAEAPASRVEAVREAATAEPEKLTNASSADPPASLPVISQAPAKTDVARAPSVPCNPPADSVAVRGPKIQASAEYLLWLAKGSQVPPLLTTSPPNGQNGIPGTVPGAAVLIGGEDLDDATRNGVRIGLTYWIDRCASYGFDGRIFFTGRVTNSEVVSSLQPNGQDISLFRPFIAANTFTFGGVPLPGPFVEQITANGVASGTFTAESSSYFWGAEANYRDNLWCRSNCDSSLRFDLLAGFRYLHLDESLRMTENAVRRSPSRDFPDEVIGTRIVLFDQFDTTNDFYGAQVGSVASYRRNKWTFDMRTAIAMGATHQKLSIDGGQIRAPLANGGAFTARGGLLALPGANIGTYTRDVFSVVPEVGLNLGYQVTDHWRFFGGYNFLYWTNVLRPGDQIDPVIDVTRVPRFVPPAALPLIQPVYPPRPSVPLATTDFWAQGLNLGVEYRW